MITGAHSIIYSKNPEPDRAFLRDALKLPNVDVGDGWLIFGLPPEQPLRGDPPLEPGRRRRVAGEANAAEPRLRLRTATGG